MIQIATFENEDRIAISQEINAFIGGFHKAVTPRSIKLSRGVDPGTGRAIYLGVVEFETSRIDLAQAPTDWAAAPGEQPAARLAREAREATGCTGKFDSVDVPCDPFTPPEGLCAYCRTHDEPGKGHPAYKGAS